MHSTILIVLLVSLLIGESSARRPVERSAVANQAAAARKRCVSS
jgi:hypothetical protein